VVVKYIANQEAHHRKKTFQKEYLQYLEKFAVEYNEKYLFDFLVDPDPLPPEPYPPNLTPP
jgi:hypothetical protein